MNVCDIMQNKTLNLTENMPLTKRKDSILRKAMCMHAKSHMMSHMLSHTC